MLTGSVASSLQGEPRSTHDIDVVVAIQKSAVKKLVESFPPPDFYADEDSAFDAINKQKMFNITDALRVYEVQFEKLDTSYMEHWAIKLDVEPLWKQLKDKAETT